MVLTPRRWWQSIPDQQRPAWRAAAESGVLPLALADQLEAAGFGVVRHGGAAFMPPRLAEEVLEMATTTW
jgi:hypothetical protein